MRRRGTPRCGGDPEAFGAALDRWVAHFRSVGIETIAGGLVALRKRPEASSVIVLEGAGGSARAGWRPDSAAAGSAGLLRAGPTTHCWPSGWRRPRSSSTSASRRAAARGSARRGLALRVDVDEATVGLVAELGGGNIPRGRAGTPRTSSAATYSSATRRPSSSVSSCLTEVCGSIERWILDPRLALNGA